MNVGPPSAEPENGLERKSYRGTNAFLSWVQYGGMERRYEAVDMGPAMILELALLPKIRGGGDDSYCWGRRSARPNDG